MSESISMWLHCDAANLNVDSQGLVHGKWSQPPRTVQAGQAFAFSAESREEALYGVEGSVVYQPSINPDVSFTIDFAVPMHSDNQVTCTISGNDGKWSVGDISYPATGDHITCNININHT